MTRTNESKIYIIWFSNKKIIGWLGYEAESLVKSMAASS